MFAPLNYMVSREEAEQRVDAVLERLGLQDLKYRHNHKLSGGEKRMAAIATILAMEPEVILMDEPTSALDPLAEYEVYKQFHTLVGGKTAFYISHRLSSCKFCDSIAVFSEGKIAEYGSHDELISIPSGIYAKMFEAQAKYYRDAS
jgi:energy-coupling factor transporter ATP-binding protein EcfA2